MKKTLLKHIQEWIEPGSTIVSDYWKAYSNLSKCGYIHKTVNHSVEFVSLEGYDDPDMTQTNKKVIGGR